MRIFLLSIVLLFAACDTPQQHAAPSPTPAAFQEQNALGDVKTSLGSGRGWENVMEELFKEELERDTVLASLVRRLGEQDRAHVDSMKTTKNYIAHNAEYYAQAIRAGEQISDSLIAAPIRSVVGKDEARYKAGIARNMDLVQRYDSLRTRNQDLLTVVKLRRTLRIMRTYQDANRPPTAVLEREAKRISALEKELSGQIGL